MTSGISYTTKPQIFRQLSHYLLHVLNGSQHKQALVIYMLIAAGHFSEHLIQIFQYLVLGWSAQASGGILGLWFPGLAASEVLHSTYNTFQLTGLILLAYGFKGTGAAQKWWTTALVFQSWHWLEHAFLQVQYLSGYYFYGAIKQMSVLEAFFPRIELHFVYNLLGFTPTLIAIILYFNKTRKQSTPEGIKLSNTMIQNIEFWIEQQERDTLLKEKLERLNQPTHLSPSSKEARVLSQLVSFAHQEKLFDPVEQAFLSKANSHVTNQGKLSPLQKAFVKRLYQVAKQGGFQAK